MKPQPEGGVGSLAVCSSPAPPHEPHPRDAPRDSRLASGGRVANGGQRAYVLPRVESTAVDGQLPSDVVAEWSGAGVEDLAATPELYDATNTRAEENVLGGLRGCKACSATNARAEEGSTYGERQSPGRRWMSMLPGSFTRRADVREYPIDDEAIVYDPRTQMLYHLNQAALAIWRACDGRTIRDIANALARTYDADSDATLGHVSQIVSLFAVGGLLDREKEHA